MANSSERTATPADRIERVSRLMIWVITAGGAIMVLAYTSVWVVPGWLEDAAAQNLLGATATISAGPVLRLFAALIAALPLALVLYGLWQIRELFRLFGDRHYFSVDGSKRLLRFGAALLLAAPAGIVTRSIVSVLLTMNNPEGSRHLVVQMGSNDYFLVVVGGLLLVVGWVMREAARMQHELQQIV